MTKTAQPPTATAIRDHPAERIAFLETVMGERYWTATIHPEALPAGVNAETFRKTLEKGNLATELIRDAAGHAAIRVRHLGTQAGVGDNIRSLGVGRGLRHAIESLPEQTRDSFHALHDSLHYVTGDAARLSAAFYMLGEVFLMAAGFARTKGDAPHLAKGLEHRFAKMKDPANWLQSLYGLLGSVQSLIFLNYAHQGHDTRLKQLEHQQKQVTGKGGNPLDISAWEDGKPAHIGWLGPLDRLLRRHPIEAGSLTQIMASASLSGANALQWRDKTRQLSAGGLSDAQREALQENIRGNQWGIARSINSATAWGLLMTPSRAPDTQEQSGPGANNTYQSIRKNPQRLASAMMSLSSLGGIVSAHKKGNSYEGIGEAIYLLGDASIFMLKSGEYGKSGSKAEDFAAEAAARFISSSTMLLGPEETQRFAYDLGAYIARQMHIEEVTQDSGTTPPAEAQAAFGQHIAEKTLEKLAETPQKIDRIARHAAQLLRQFSPQAREGIRSGIIASLMHTPHVYMQSKTLTTLIQAEESRMESLVNGPTPSQPPGMPQLAPPLSALLLELPPLDAAHAAGHLYDTLLPHITPTAHDLHHLQQQTQRQVAENTGIPAAALNELQRDMQAETALQR